MLQPNTMTTMIAEQMLTGTDTQEGQTNSDAASAELLTSELHLAYEYAETLGMFADDLLDSMLSREWTGYKAKLFVRSARSKAHSLWKALHKGHQ